VKKVVIGMLGPSLDKAIPETRWEKWRPSVSIFQHDDFLVDRLELIYQPHFKKLKDTVIEDINSISPETKVVTHKMTFRDPWSFDEVYSGLHEFAKNYQFRPAEEEYFVHITTGTHVIQICLFLLVESHYIPGKLLQTGPEQRSRNQKSLTGGPVYQIIDLDLSKYDTIMTRYFEEQKEGLNFLKSGIATKNEEFNQLISKIETVSLKSTDPLLLMGPTGAGKSELAKKIYSLKKNKNKIKGIMVEVNCGTLRGDSAMSTLFGHIKGAFTGAQTDRLGLIAGADNGLLFLDEIGELGPDEQTMLLKAIEEKKFYPLGSDKEVKSDFQLIAGTNKDLYIEASRGNFRADLLARINMWSFELPGLKERPEDIDPNIDFELIKISKKMGQQISFSKESREKFLRLSKNPEALWSGNFRDLNTVMTRMATLSEKGRIDEGLVESEMKTMYGSWEKLGSGDKRESKIELADYLSSEQIRELDPFDLPQLKEVIRVCLESKNISHAGRVLFSKSREKRKSVNDSDRLLKYLNRFGVEGVF